MNKSTKNILSFTFGELLMNIKEKIGQRIEEERKILGYTRKELAERTDDLKQTRINNWERGIRTPGPQEIKQLAKALSVSPAYLMCLSDEKQQNSPLEAIPGLGALLPLLDQKQAVNFQSYTSRENGIGELTFIPIPDLNSDIGKNAFALKMKDESMSPDFKINDILIIDPDRMPEPGNFVVTQIKNDDQVIIRRYKQLSVHKSFQEFELVPANDNWAKIVVNHEKECIIIGVVNGFFRFC